MGRTNRVSLKIVPPLNPHYLKTFTGIIRCIEIQFCFLAAVSTKFFARCYHSEKLVPRNESYHDVDVFPIRLCVGPQMHAYTMFSLVTQFAFFLNLTVLVLQLTNIEKEFQSVPWIYVVLFHTGSSSILLLIASTVVIADQYKDTSIYVGCIFAFCAFIAFTCHFLWEMKSLFMKIIIKRSAKRQQHENSKHGTQSAGHLEFES